MPLRVIAALVWIALAFWGQRSSVRPIFAYVGAIVACIHIFGAAIGFAVKRVQGGYDFSGLVAGVVIGLIVGVFIGKLAAGSQPVYWAVQIIAAGFVAYLPLVPL
jgi:hypothetical protein